MAPSSIFLKYSGLQEVARLRHPRGQAVYTAEWDALAARWAQGDHALLQPAEPCWVAPMLFSHNLLKQKVATNELELCGCRTKRPSYRSSPWRGRCLRVLTPWACAGSGLNQWYQRGDRHALSVGRQGVGCRLWQRPYVRAPFMGRERWWT